jgi:hypothetical protein
VCDNRVTVASASQEESTRVLITGQGCKAVRLHRFLYRGDYIPVRVVRRVEECTHIRQVCGDHPGRRYFEDLRLRDLSIYKLTCFTCFDGRMNQCNVIRTPILLLHDFDRIHARYAISTLRTVTLLIVSFPLVHT